MCGEDMALPASRTIQVMGKKIPDDISVISIENESVSKYLFPAHTTIDPDFPRIGRTAAEKLAGIIRGEIKPKEENIKIENKIIERESVKKI
jgi:LacI family transcriptional regulator